MTKTVTSNYTSIAAPGNTFNQRISADSDTFARNDVDALGNGLELHDHSSGKGLAVNVIPSGGLTITAGGLQVTAGNVGIGTGPSTNNALAIIETLTGFTAQRGIYANPTGDSGATAEISAVVGVPQTAAAAFTCATVAGFHANNPTKGAGSTITSAYGLLVDGITSGNTNNYGIFVNAPSGGSGSNIGIANNGDYVPGPSGTTMNSGFVMINSAGGPPTATPTNHASGRAALYHDTTNGRLYVWNEAGLAWHYATLT